VSGGPTDYFDCGAGHDYDNTTSNNVTVPAGASVFFAAPTVGGFCGFTFYNATTMTVDLIDGTGDGLYSFTKTNTRKGARLQQ
jgi:hypothetical protein